MKAMLTGFLAVAVIGVGAWYGLGQAGFSTQEVTSGSAVRLD
ncbi:MAG: hypothetical protein ACPGFC_04310 [Paracoccaceae bacterium]